MSKIDTVTWAVREPLSDRELQELFSTVYNNPNTVPFHTILAHCLTWVSARRGGKLSGFANLIWDGLYHGLIVDRCALDEDLHLQVALKMLETLKRDHPTITKIHIECSEKEIPVLEPLGFQRRVYGRVLF